MLAAATIILIAVILCGTVLLWAYMRYCSENRIKIFESLKTQKRIDKLEEKARELETMISDMKAEKK